MFAKTYSAFLSLWLIIVTMGATSGTPNISLYEERRNGTVATSTFNPGKPIYVNFTNYTVKSDETTPLFIIYKESSQNGDSDSPLDDWLPDDQLYLWSYTCNNQTDCDDDRESYASGSGQVKFWVTPYSDYDENEHYAPLNNGNYRVCLVDETGDEYEIDGSCVQFRVKSITPAYVDAATVEVTYPNVTIHTNWPQPNQWLGLYNTSDITADLIEARAPLPDEIAWSYTHCSGINGDEPNTESCSNTNGSNKNITTFEWPLDLSPGDYTMCMNFLSNAPLNRYKCSVSFSVE